MITGEDLSSPYFCASKEKRFSKTTLYENVNCEKITIIRSLFV